MTGVRKINTSANVHFVAKEDANMVRDRLPEAGVPRAPLALRIGVTGHKPEPVGRSPAELKRPYPDAAAIRATVAQVCVVIQEAFNGVAETNTDLFDCSAARSGSDANAKGTLRIVSALAEGADQWVSDEAVKLGYDLQAILPFGRDEYRKDFVANPQARSEFDRLLSLASAVLELDGEVGSDAEGARKPDNHSYEAVGRSVLNQTDLLIAVWDGRQSHGPGGTSEVVTEALRRGIPVVWVPWEGPADWQLKLPRWRLLEHPDSITSENERLMQLVRDLLIPPDLRFGSYGECEEHLRRAYFGEEQKGWNALHGWWSVFRNVLCGEIMSQRGIVQSLLSFHVDDFEANERRTSCLDWAEKKSDPGTPMDAPMEEQTRRWVDVRYAPHYAWANGLSMYYGNLYRSAFLMNYLLGAVAVALALVSVAFSMEEKHQPPWIVAELLVIVGILTLTNVGRRRRWHERWIDYRTLAERLRLARCLSLFGGGGAQAVYAGHLASYGDPAHTWMHWHYRAIERAACVIPVELTQAYLKSSQEFWRESLLHEQRDYHKSVVLRFTKLDHRLHRTGDWLFVATLIACVLHAGHLWIGGCWVFQWLSPHCLTAACAVLPALGAAFAAIRSQSEAQRMAQRSRAMHDALTRLQLDLASVKADANALNSQRLRVCAERVIDLMAKELLDWRVVFQDRPLGLPS